MADEQSNPVAEGHARLECAGDLKTARGQRLVRQCATRAADGDAGGMRAGHRTEPLADGRAGGFVGPGLPVQGHGHTTRRRSVDVWRPLRQGQRGHACLRLLDHLGQQGAKVREQAPGRGGFEQVVGVHERQHERVVHRLGVERQLERRVRVLDRHGFRRVRTSGDVVSRMSGRAHRVDLTDVQVVHIHLKEGRA